MSLSKRDYDFIFNYRKHGTPMEEDFEVCSVILEEKTKTDLVKFQGPFSVQYKEDILTQQWK